MKKINLTLTKVADNNQIIEYSLDKAIEENNLIVILGAPGSGKSSILEKYQTEHEATAQFLKIKKFLRLEPKIIQGTKILLLDGLDEYRNTETDKTFVIDELAANISQLQDIKIVIACREMDWFGDYDQKALEYALKNNPAVLRLEPLNANQKQKMSELYEIADKKTFFDKFDHFGFLDNPQLFKMAVEIYKQNKEPINSKKELFEYFIKNSREFNQENLLNKINNIEPEKNLINTGYLAFYYFFTEVEEFDEAFIDKISLKDEGFSKDSLNITLSTAIFRNKNFSHRTLAEFSFAYFIANYLLKRPNSISKERIKNFLVTNSRVPSAIRGCYAWLCSLTGDDFFINEDPYYQIIYGDNSCFTFEQKKKVISAVKQYYVNTPYFSVFDQTNSLKNIYHETMDDFLIEELNKSISIKNNYIIFIIEILTSALSLSLKIKAYIEKTIKDNSIDSYLRARLIDCFRPDINKLMEFLNLIKSNELIDDKNAIKETLLKILYPDHISAAKIVPYLMLYSKNKKVIGYCRYLNITKYEDKRSIIDEIFKLSKAEGAKNLDNNLEMFINDYFVETLLKYMNPFSAKEIFEIIKHFKQYYGRYEKIEFRTYNTILQEQLKNHDQKLSQLTNELFELYLDELIYSEKISLSLWHFSEFFSLKTPDNKTKILLSRIQSQKSFRVNEALFIEAYNYSVPEDLPKIQETAKQYQMEQLLQKLLNPPKPEWEIEQENRSKKEKEKIKKILEDNENYFKKYSDEELIKNFNAMRFIAEQIYFKKNNDESVTDITKETFLHLKSILAKVIYDPCLSDANLITLQSLAKTAPKAERYLDMVYYTASCLETDTNAFENISNDNFLKYLYLINVIQGNMCDVIKGQLIDFIEKKPDSAKNILIEYINLLLQAHLKHCHSAILKYFKSTDIPISLLKSFILIFAPSEEGITDCLIKNFLNAFHFKIKLNDLNKLKTVTTNEKILIIIKALETFKTEAKLNFTQDMAIAIHSLIDEKEKKQLTSLNDSKLKVRIIDYMINCFNDKTSLKFKSGFQSPKDSCASFLKTKSLDLLNLYELKELLEYHKSETDIWNLRIKDKISILKQKDSDQEFSYFSIDKIQNFIFSKKIVSQKDFFIDICEKIDDFKSIIEANSDNDKDPFYNSNLTSKNEESCRDVIYQRLKDKYGYTLNLTKEKYEAYNRVDLNVSYIENKDFKVQIECKKDSNSKILTGINHQLIDKYLSQINEYGIYLIFYFEEQYHSKEKLIEEVEKTIPQDKKNKIKVICIDLTYGKKSPKNKKSKSKKNK